MRARPLLVLAAIPCLLLAFAQPPGSDTGLADAMEGIKRSLQALSGTIADPEQNAASLASLTEMQVWALQAKLERPANLDEVPAARRDAHAAAFRADILRLIVRLAQMEIDVLEGRNAEAKAAIKTDLFDMRSVAHDKYQSDN